MRESSSIPKYEVADTNQVLLTAPPQNNDVQVYAKKVAAELVGTAVEDFDIGA